MIKLIYPDPDKLKLAGAKPVSAVSLRWTDNHPQSHYGLGVLLYNKSPDIFDGAAFRAARDIFGAQLIYNGIEHRLICSSLGVPQKELGVIEGYTQSDYARLKKVSRQYINEQLLAEKLQTIKIGVYEFIIPIKNSK